MSLLASSNPSTPSTDAAPRPPVNLLPLLLAGLIGLNACGFCQVAANKSTARCKAEAVTTDCAAPEIIKLVESILPDVFAAFTSGDWGNLLATVDPKLQGQGISDVWGVITCAINKVESMPRGFAPASFARAEAFKKAHPHRVK